MDRLVLHCGQDRLPVPEVAVHIGDYYGDEIMKPENQKKAYEFVKELNKRTDMTNVEKAKEFNRQMFEWAKKMGKKMTESVVNCLRELAVNALKVEKAEAKENGEECDCCVDKTESEDA